MVVTTPSRDREAVRQACREFAVPDGRGSDFFHALLRRGGEALSGRGEHQSES